MAGPSRWIPRLRVRRAWLAVALIAGLAGGQPLAAQAPAALDIANGGFESGEAGGPPLQWMGTVGAQGADGSDPVYRPVIDTDRPREGRASVRLERLADSSEPTEFGVVTNRIEAAPLRARRIRLTGAVRTEIEPGARVGLWLRVDRPRRQPGFFDNMQDRPIDSPDWADFVIEGDVAHDAESIYFGMLLSGGGRAWLDDVRLEDVGPAQDPTGTVATVGPPPRFRRRASRRIYGDVASFDVPGGYRLAWTGMRVLNRDGSRHHVVGVRPDVPAGRTLAGIRAGRDEQLERALELVPGRLGGESGTD